MTIPVTSGADVAAGVRDITRAEFAAIIIRALGLEPGVGDVTFSDVKASDWFCGYVETAVSYGIITGYTDGTFRPSSKITREEAMTMVARAMKLTGLAPALTSSESAALLEGFADSTDVSDFADESVAACLKTGVVTGKDGGRIAAKENITRAEVAVIIQRLIQKSGMI